MSTNKFVEILENEEMKKLKPYALKVKERREALEEGVFREYKTEPLEYRTEYDRDRDRIIWCRSFKRLQHKTQIFPTYSLDHFRRRLTHSLEVSQIATTIARALELNKSATEAIALGHDIGHSPFGHGGESKLNEIMAKALVKARESDNKYRGNGNIALYNFNHAMQGIEVVERIEKEYYENHFGLNLTFDVREGILKHRRFDLNKKKESDMDKISTIEEVVNFKEFKKFGLNYGSLETQCVLLADKIAYFFADFEDALRSHILNRNDLSKGPFLQFKSTLEKSVNEIRETKSNFDKKIENVDDFLKFRRKALTGLILNAIKSSEKKIRDGNVKSVGDGKKIRYISLGENIEKIKEEVYKEIMEEKVFKHDLYQLTEFKAKKILGDLFDAYFSTEELIPNDFKDTIQKSYKEFLPNKDEMKLIIVKNYIAGMTDSFAISRHKNLFMSSEEITIN